MSIAYIMIGYLLWMAKLQVLCYIRCFRQQMYFTIVVYVPDKWQKFQANDSRKISGDMFLPVQNYPS